MKRPDEYLTTYVVFCTLSGVEIEQIADYTRGELEQVSVSWFGQKYTQPGLRVDAVFYVDDGAVKFLPPYRLEK